MNYLQTSEPDLTGSMVKWLAGFFGAITAFLLLPRTLKFVLRRFVLSLVTEVVFVVLTGLLAEKAVDKLQERR